MKTFDQHILGYLKLVFGRLPLEPLLDEKELTGAFDIGEFTVEAETLIQNAREDDTVFDYLIDWYNQETNERLAKIEAFEQSIPSEILYRFDFSIFDKRRSLKKISSIEEKRLEYLAHTPLPDEKKDSLSQFKSKIAVFKEELLTEIRSEFFFTGNKGFKAIFPFSNRARNVQILGGAGSGKTELIKLFLYSDLKEGKGCFLLDPHGDISAEVSQFRCDNDKVIYLSAEFGHFGYYYRLNPFDHKFHEESEEIFQAFISVKSQELMNAFSIIMSQEFTANMQRVIFNCLQVLLSHKGMNLKDFLRFLHPATSEPYELLGQNHYSESVKLFFLHDFNSKRFEVTKSSVLTRLENTLSNYHLSKIFDCKESSFNLKKSLNQGKMVIFNLSQGTFGESGTQLLGSFIMSELTTLALQKAKIPAQFRKPWLGYLDEFQNFLTPRADKILSEARKYRLSLTVANQFLGQIQNTRLKDSILANTNIKCLGYSSYRDFEIMQKEMGFKGKKIPKLGKGRFVIKVGAYDPIVIQAYDFLIGKNSKYYLSSEQHRRRLNQNLQNYYTKVPKSQKATQKHASKTDTPKVKLPKIESIL